MLYPRTMLALLLHYLCKVGSNDGNLSKRRIQITLEQSHFGFLSEAILNRSITIATSRLWIQSFLSMLLQYHHLSSLPPSTRDQYVLRNQHVVREYLASNMYHEIKERSWILLLLPVYLHYCTRNSEELLHFVASTSLSYLLVFIVIAIAAVINTRTTRQTSTSTPTCTTKPTCTSFTLNFYDVSHDTLIPFKK